MSEPRGLVLLVEDDDGVRYGVRALLDVLGYEVAEAVDGAAGIAKFTENAARVRAVILDVQLPDMRGEEVLRAIRARSADVPVLLSTGNELDQPSGYPNVHVLAKPFGIDELSAALSAALGSSP